MLKKIECESLSFSILAGKNGSVCRRRWRVCEDKMSEQIQPNTISLVNFRQSSAFAQATRRVHTQISAEAWAVALDSVRHTGSVDAAFLQIAKAVHSHRGYCSAKNSLRQKRHADSVRERLKQKLAGKNGSE